MCLWGWRGDRSGKSKERWGGVREFGWAFVSITLQTLNNMSICHALLLLLVWNSWGGGGGVFYVGEGGTGVSKCV